MGCVRGEQGMARKVQVLLVCDMHGCEAEARGTISFAFGSAAFEIDLCASHEHDLHGVLQTYISHGRKVMPTRRPAHDPQQRQHAADIRRWARKRGIKVSDQGRIPAKVMELYAATHQ
jgi:Lsr2